MKLSTIAQVFSKVDQKERELTPEEVDLKQAVRNKMAEFSNKAQRLTSDAFDRSGSRGSDRITPEEANAIYGEAAQLNEVVTAARKLLNAGYIAAAAETVGVIEIDDPEVKREVDRFRDIILTVNHHGLFID